MQEKKQFEGVVYELLHSLQPDFQVLYLKSKEGIMTNIFRYMIFLYFFNINTTIYFGFVK